MVREVAPCADGGVFECCVGSFCFGFGEGAELSTDTEVEDTIEDG